MSEEKKFLDAEGIKYLWKKIDTNHPEEIYVGDGDMPEDATIQILLNEEGSSSQDRFEEKVISVLEDVGLIQLVRADDNTVLTDKDGNIFMF